MSSQVPDLSAAVRPEQKQAAIRLGFRLKRWAYHAEMVTWSRVFPLNSLARHLRIANLHQRMLKVTSRNLLDPHPERDAEIERIFHGFLFSDSIYCAGDFEPYWDLLRQANHECESPELEHAREECGKFACNWITDCCLQIGMRFANHFPFIQLGERIGHFVFPTPIWRNILLGIPNARESDSSNINLPQRYGTTRRFSHLWPLWPIALQRFGAYRQEMRIRFMEVGMRMPEVSPSSTFDPPNLAIAFWLLRSALAQAESCAHGNEDTESSIVPQPTLEDESAANSATSTPSTPAVTCNEPIVPGYLGLSFDASDGSYRVTRASIVATITFDTPGDWLFLRGFANEVAGIRPGELRTYDHLQQFGRDYYGRRSSSLQLNSLQSRVSDVNTRIMPLDITLENKANTGYRLVPLTSLGSLNSHLDG